MKKIVIVLLTLIVVMAVGIPLFAQDSATPATAEGTGVNIRSGPGTDYSLRGGLIKGSLTITGRNEFDTTRVCTNINARDLDMWLRVDYNGVEGWLALCAVDIDVDLATIPVVESSHPLMIEDIDYSKTVSAIQLGDEPETFVFGVTRARVNLREGAGLDSNIIQELRGSELVYVTGMNADGSWVKVEAGDVSGWVARYLMFLPYEWQKTFVKDAS